jgi:hypothetical protein
LLLEVLEYSFGRFSNLLHFFGRQGPVFCGLNRRHGGGS